MDKTELRKEARLYFIPFLLGNNEASHKLSKKIYQKYKIICYILDTKSKLTDIFDFSSKVLKVTETKSSLLTASELIYLAEQTPYTLPLLIPCDAEYEKLVNEQRELLESIFIISSKEALLNDSPLSVIP